MPSRGPDELALSLACPDAWGIGDIEEQMQVSRVTILKWRKHRFFPPPGFVNARGTMIFDPDQIIRWAIHNGGTVRARNRARVLARERKARGRRVARREAMALAACRLYAEGLSDGGTAARDALRGRLY